ncbi:hypothetical protein AB4254_11665 [Vibrio breoganii]
MKKILAAIGLLLLTAHQVQATEIEYPGVSNCTEMMEAMQNQRDIYFNNDIDCSGEELVMTWNFKWPDVVDGQGYKLTNLEVFEGKNYVGLFYSNYVLKNLTVDGVKFHRHPESTYDFILLDSSTNSYHKNLTIKNLQTSEPLNRVYYGVGGVVEGLTLDLEGVSIRGTTMFAGSVSRAYISDVVVENVHFESTQAASSLFSSGIQNTLSIVDIEFRNIFVGGVLDRFSFFSRSLHAVYANGVTYENFEFENLSPTAALITYQENWSSSATGRSITNFSHDFWGNDVEPLIPDIQILANTDAIYETYASPDRYPLAPPQQCITYLKQDYYWFN